MYAFAEYFTTCPSKVALHIRVGINSVDNFRGQIESFSVALYDFDHSHALFVVFEPARIQFVERALTVMTERRMSQIVSQSDSLGQILVQPHGSGDSPRYLRDLKRVSQPRPVMVGFRDKKYLRLMFKPPERVAVYNSVTVALGFRADLQGVSPAFALCHSLAAFSHSSRFFVFHCYFSGQAHKTTPVSLQISASLI